jgi:hypothetical protein
MVYNSKNDQPNECYSNEIEFHKALHSISPTKNSALPEQLKEVANRLKAARNSG